MRKLLMLLRILLVLRRWLLVLRRRLLVLRGLLVLWGLWLLLGVLRRIALRRLGICGRRFIEIIIVWIHLNELKLDQIFSP